MQIINRWKVKNGRKKSLLLQRWGLLCSLLLELSCNYIPEWSLSSLAITFLDWETKSVLSLYARNQPGLPLWHDLGLLHLSSDLERGTRRPSDSLSLDKKMWFRAGPEVLEAPSATPFLPSVICLASRHRVWWTWSWCLKWEITVQRLGIPGLTQFWEFNSLTHARDGSCLPIEFGCLYFGKTRTTIPFI